MTTRPCGVTDSELMRFAEGGAVELETHVGTCEDCQRVLEAIWSDGADLDLSPAVLRTLRLDEFVMDAVGLAADIGTLMLRAALLYTTTTSYQEGDE